LIKSMKEPVLRFQEIVRNEHDMKSFAELRKSGLLKRVGKDAYRTVHGDLVIKTLSLADVPGNPLRGEFYLMEPMVTCLPDMTSPNLNTLRDLRDEMIKFLRDFSLEGGEVDEVVDALIYAFDSTYGRGGPTKLNKFQYEAIKKFLDKRGPSVEVLSAPTGTGKTLIFMIFAFLITIAEKLQQKVSGPYALFIYPRKALARDQASSILKLLYYYNKYLYEKGKELLENYGITVAILDGDSPYYVTDEKEEGPSVGSTVRNVRVKVDCGTLECVYGKTSVRCTCNGKRLDVERVLKRPLFTDYRKDVTGKTPDMVISNIWMFEQHAWKHKRISAVFIRPKLVVLDEAHVYTNVQQIAVSSIFYRWIIRKLIEDTDTGVSETNIPEKIDEYFKKERNLTLVISSATIYSKKGASPQEKVDKIKSFVSYLITPGLHRRFEELGTLNINDYELVIGESECNLKKKVFTILMLPHGDVSARTLFRYVLLNASTWSVSTDLHGHAQKFIAFFDSKNDLEILFQKWLRKVMLNKRYDHFDRFGCGVWYEDDKPRACECLNELGVAKDVDLENPPPELNLRAKYAWSIALKEISGAHCLNELEPDQDVAERLLRDDAFWFSYATKYDSENFVGDVYKALKFMGSLSRRLAVHYADMDLKSRVEVESKFKEGELLGIGSTSTMEVGIDIDDVSVILQYRLPRKAESFVQRAGRAGRSVKSLYLSLVMLVLPSSQSIYVHSTWARERLYEIDVKKPPYKNVGIMLDVLARLLDAVGPFAIRDVRAEKLFKQCYSRSNVERLVPEIVSKVSESIRKLLIVTLKDMLNVPNKELGLNEAYLDKLVNKFLYHLTTYLDDVQRERGELEGLENVVSARFEEVKMLLRKKNAELVKSLGPLIDQNFVPFIEKYLEDTIGGIESIKKECVSQLVNTEAFAKCIESKTKNLENIIKRIEAVLPTVVSNAEDKRRATSLLNSYRKEVLKVISKALEVAEKQRKSA